jgi:hypothetical protein
MTTDTPESVDIRHTPHRVSRPSVSDTKGMPVPSKRLKELVEGTVDHHASKHWPVLGEVTITWRGSFGYLTGWIEADNEQDDEQIKLCRIQYLGNDDEWAFAIYDPATETYTHTILRTGSFTGHPNDALDTAAIVHLADHTP